MTRAVRVQAQAKINLFLRIHPGTDTDGYHRLDTLFQRIDLTDDVEIRLSGASRSLEALGGALPPAGLGAVEKNLAYRAATAYLERNGDGLPRGFEIRLEKRIPVGGGLGGGSADAGAVLRALQALSPRPLSADQLWGVARSLGADVPFLAAEHASAHGSGRGDVLAPFHHPEPADVLLVVPSFAIGTADAYRWLDEDRGAGLHGAQHPEAGLGERVGWQTFAANSNDFEAVIERRFPKIRDYRETLKSNGATVARLSGSGSTVFGIFASGAPAPESLGLDCQVIRTRTSARVVQVEVLQ